MHNYNIPVSNTMLCNYFIVKQCYIMCNRQQNKCYYKGVTLSEKLQHSVMIFDRSNII